MEKYILQGVPLKITKEELLKTLKMPAETAPEDEKAIGAMMEECMKTANPKALYGIAAIEEKGADFVISEGVRVQSALVRQNLDQANRIIPYVATCGAEAEEWSRRYSDPLESYWADGIKMVLLGKIRQELSHRVKAEYFPGGDMSAMSPGSLAAWPITQQACIFGMFGSVEEDIGVRLTPSFLMLPSKSCSGFFFSPKSHYENCVYCPIPNCPGRRAPYGGKPFRAEP